MEQKYTLNGIQYNIIYSTDRKIQWMQHIGDGKFRPHGSMDIPDESWTLSTLINMAHKAKDPKSGDIVNIFHPAVAEIWGSEPAKNKDGTINFLTFEQGP